MLKKWKNKLPLQKLIEELLKRKLPDQYINKIALSIKHPCH
jgi:hypothetical protein